jgi:hypothetical protein
MPVIITTREAEIRRTVVQSQSPKYFGRPYLKKKKKKNHHNKELVEWLKW